MAPRRRSIRLLIPLLAAGCVGHAPPPVNPYQATSEEMNDLLTQIAWFADTMVSLPDSLPQLCPSGDPSVCGWMRGENGFLDAWERPFRYARMQGDEFELRSAGPDGAFQTADDVVYRPSVERALVARVSGCYRVLQTGWSEFPGDELRLDSVEVPGNPALGRRRWYRAAPGLAAATPFWEAAGTVGGDALVDELRAARGERHALRLFHHRHRQDELPGARPPAGAGAGGAGGVRRGQGIGDRE